MVNKKQSKKITAELIAKKKVVCERPTMPQEKKKTERERRKYLEPKKYEVFKKKEAAHVGEYHLKKVNYWSVLLRQPQAQYQAHFQHFQQNNF